MGVQGLWHLLSPVGERVPNSHVQNKKLAIDASIWLTQFIKAMRESDGARMPNAHLLGVFRRCCKLLFLNIKPVLVFDGATPALKRRTRQLRAAQRDNDVLKLRRLAEKILTNQLKHAAVDAVSNASAAKKRKRSGNSNSISSQPTSSTPKRPRRNDDMYAIANEAPAKNGAEEFDDDEYNAPYQDIDEPEVSVELPEDIHEIDDDALVNMPDNITAEIFKQIRAAQRAQHRKQVLERNTDPESFSKAQIAGFIKNSNLNRRIRTVRTQINDKSGASHRIASDATRGFSLEEGDHVDDEENGAEANDENIEFSDSDDDNVDGGNEIIPRKERVVSSTSKGDQQLDLLVRIRMERERKQKDNGFQIHRPESDIDNVVMENVGWAAKVLDGEGTHKLGVSINDFKVSNDEDDIIRDEDDSDDSIEWEDGKAESTETKPVLVNEDAVVLDVDEINPEIQEAILLSSKTRFKDRDNSNCSKPPMYPKKLVGAVPTVAQVVNSSKKVGMVEEKEAKRKEIKPVDSNKDGHIDQGNNEESTNEIDTVELANDGEEDKQSEILIEGKTNESKPSEDNNDLETNITQELKVVHSSREISTDGLKFNGEEDVGNINEEKLVERPREIESAEIEPDNAEVVNTAAVPGKRVTFSDAPVLERADSEGTRDSPVDLDELGKEEKKGEREEDVARESPVDLDKLGKEEKKGEREEDVARNVDSDGSGEADGKIYDDDPLVAGEATEFVDAESKRITEAESILENVERAEDGVAPVVTNEDLERVRQNLENEREELLYQHASQERMVGSISEEMISDTCELLQLFGIPYMKAPFEAEAQCAYLNLKNVVDGVISEDSDTLLFGAKIVYRKLFATEGKFAEAYHVESIEREMGITREKLITLAHLLGSDYTPGVRGIGIVNAMEVLNAFPNGEDDLKEFFEWTKTVTILDEEPDTDGENAVRREFCWKHRTVKRNWIFRSETFPNKRVSAEYRNPPVNRSVRSFDWKTVPDFDGLERFCYKKFGWNSDKFKQSIGPLKKEIEARTGVQRQRTIHEFFQPYRFAKIKSKRLQAAVRGMSGSADCENIMVRLAGSQADHLLRSKEESQKLDDLFWSIDENYILEEAAKIREKQPRKLTQREELMRIGREAAER